MGIAGAQTSDGIGFHQIGPLETRRTLPPYRCNPFPSASSRPARVPFPVCLASPSPVLAAPSPWPPPRSLSVREGPGTRTSTPRPQDPRCAAHPIHRPLARPAPSHDARVVPQLLSKHTSETWNTCSIKHLNATTSKANEIFETYTCNMCGEMYATSR
jgi:hypothetical protein